MLGLLLRAYVVWTTPVGDATSWREADVLAMARSFAHEGDSILRPRVDWRGSTSGVVECELPWIAYALSGLFHAGIDDRLGGRGFVVLFTLLGLPALYDLVKREYGVTAAAWAAALYWLAPLNVYYGAQTQPHPIVVTLMMLTLWAAQRWLSSGGWTWCIATAALLAWTLLTWLPSALVGLPLLVLGLRRRGLRFLARLDTWVVAAVGIGPTVMWYLHAHQLFAETGLTFGIWSAVSRETTGNQMIGKFDMLSSWTSADYWTRMGGRLATVWLSPPGAGVVALVGWVVLARRDGLRVMGAWLAAGLVFVLVAARGNFHAYYQMLFVPGLAALAAAGGMAAWRAWAPSVRPRTATGLALALVAGTAAGAGAFVYERVSRPSDFAAFGRFIAAQSAPGALVVALQPGFDLDSDARPFYHADRRGWVVGKSHVTATDGAHWRAAGARVFVVRNKHLDKLARSGLAGWLATEGAHAESDGEFTAWKF
ncbi:MAG: glycosyltransferase family 39 protein [Phycisphaerae bacterium]